MRKEIEKYLEELGFVKDGNVYHKLFQQQTGEVIVNNQRQVTVQEVDFCLEYIGEGWEGDSEEKNHPLTQWKLSVNGKDIGEFLVHDLDEFKKTFNK